MPIPLDDNSVLDRLLARRIVLLSGPLDHRLATDAAAQLMLLDASGDDPIELHVSCPDGELEAAGMLAETIDLVGVEVRAMCRGTVGGPALAVLAAAHRRVAHAHALFRLTEPKVHMEGRADELAVLVDAHQRQLAALHQRLAAATGRPVERIEADMQSGRSLTAAAAVTYGLVHELVGPPG